MLGRALGICRVSECFCCCWTLGKLGYFLLLFSSHKGWTSFLKMPNVTSYFCGVTLTLRTINHSPASYRVVAVFWCGCSSELQETQTSICKAGNVTQQHPCSGLLMTPEPVTRTKSCVPPKWNCLIMWTKHLNALLFSHCTIRRECLHLHFFHYSTQSFATSAAVPVMAQHQTVQGYEGTSYKGVSFVLLNNNTDE